MRDSDGTLRSLFSSTLTVSTDSTCPGSRATAGGMAGGMWAIVVRALAWPVAALRGFSVVRCCWNLSFTTHRLVFPQVVRFGTPALLTAILVGVSHPAVLVAAAALALVIVAVSLLPQGHALLQYRYLCETHTHTHTHTI